MQPYKHKILLAVSLSILAVILALLALPPGLGALKGAIESRVSESSGMRVVIGGRLSVSLFPGAAITLRAVSAREAGEDVVKVKEVKIWLALRQLLRFKVGINRLDLVSPSLRIIQGITGASRTKESVTGTAIDACISNVLWRA